MIHPIPRQPIAFGDQFELCGLNVADRYKRLVEVGDVVNFQVRLSPINNAELITDGDFASGAPWTFGTNWTYDSTDDEADAAAADSGDQLSESGIIAVDVAYYLVTFTVKNYVSGNIRILLGGSAAQDVTINANGIYSVLMFSGGISTGIQIQGVDAAPFTGSLDDISIKKLSTLIWRLRDQDSNVFLTDEDNMLGYVTYLTGQGCDRGMALLSFPTADIDFGDAICFTICLRDKYNEEWISNGTFASTDDWGVSNASWSITGGHAEYDGVVTSYISQTLQQETLPNYEYTVEFTVSGLGGDGTITLQIIDVTPGGTHDLLSVTTDGTYSVSFTGHRVSSIAFRGDGDGAFESPVELDNVTMDISTEAGADFCSNQFHFTTFGCTLQLAWRNDISMILPRNEILNYEDFSFTQYYRFLGAIWKPRMEEEFVWETDSIGGRHLLNYNASEVFVLNIDHCPAYVQSALAVAFGHRSVWLDNREITRFDSGWSPTWSRYSVNAPVRIECIYQDEINENQPVEEVGCY